jgi:hypothetical protein
VSDVAILVATGDGGKWPKPLIDVNFPSVVIAGLQVTSVLM